MLPSVISQPYSFYDSFNKLFLHNAKLMIAGKRSQRSKNSNGRCGGSSFFFFFFLSKLSLAKPIGKITQHKHLLSVAKSKYT